MRIPIWPGVRLSVWEKQNSEAVKVTMPNTVMRGPVRRVLSKRGWMILLVRYDWQKWPVQPLMVIHNAPVAGGRFVVEGIPVMPAHMLVQALVLNDGVRDPRAVLLGERAERVLPPYR